ncbi:hypothetical protein KUCAC02_000035, partial [Chaenocephalus aceratus]
TFSLSYPIPLSSPLAALPTPTIDRTQMDLLNTAFLHGPKRVEVGNMGNKFWYRHQALPKALLQLLLYILGSRQASGPGSIGGLRLKRDTRASAFIPANSDLHSQPRQAAPPRALVIQRLLFVPVFARCAQSALTEEAEALTAELRIQFQSCWPYPTGLYSPNWTMIIYLRHGRCLIRCCLGTSSWKRPRH